jgi:hypothetical protein
MKPIVIAVLLSLAGCATKHQEPVIVTKEVLVPVTTKCKIERPVRPVEALPKAQPATSFYDKGVMVLFDLEAWRQYAGLLEKALDACSEPAK